MTKTTTARDFELEMAIKAFSSDSASYPRQRDIRISPAGTILVLDPISGTYTTCHILTASKLIAALSRDELVLSDEGTHGMPTTLEIFERIDGNRYGIRKTNGYATTCPADSETPGRLRRMDHSPASLRQKQIDEIRRRCGK